MPSIGLLAYSHIVDDPRVRRQGDLFHAAGWTVWGVGIPGGLSPDPAWCIVSRHGDLPGSAAGQSTWAASKADFLAALWHGPLPSPFKAMLIPGVVAARKLRTLNRYWAGRGSFDAALSSYWSFPQFRRLYEEARRVKPDIWLANDWNTLPIAARLSEETGVPFAYDTHEFATSEYEERHLWRLFQKPVIRLIEEGLIGRARVVSSVSPGISRALQDEYSLEKLPMTVLNAPIYEKAVFQPAREPVRVLYHGAVSVGRGLEETILSVASWRDGRSLTIRGPADPSYLRTLQALSRKQGVEARVDFVPPVPMVDMVKAAQPFDIGILALPNHSRHNKFALPNKLFEYTMAGLAVCMSDLPEMSRIIGQHQLGTTIESVDAASIAEAINGMDTDSIDRYKRNALKAANTLSWDEAGKTVLAAYTEIVAGPGALLPVAKY